MAVWYRSSSSSSSKSLKSLSAAALLRLLPALPLRFAPGLSRLSLDPADRSRRR